jgi:alpha-tubulin suppressor-like RCC1 family protein
MNAVGDGTGIERARPVRVELPPAVHVAAGAYQTCALLRTGEVACWGDGGYGQIGDGTTMPHPTPTVLRGLVDIVEIAGGAQHTCARAGSGAVWCWGADRATKPQPIRGVTATQLALGMASACALGRDGTVTCWGYLHDGLITLTRVPGLDHGRRSAATGRRAAP